ncbi:transposase, MuDR, MULE transposase domain protein [Tanacetum coccineum]|uniref:Transposase, MuDR, MULE transposase domain protein n=1 Tax=Tanacetum coccineum TaxID=301880 RepID=A0ABQ5CRA2_9ASTR
MKENIPNRGRREQFPSKYKLTPFMEQPPTTILPKERVNKTKNKGTKANLSPLNLGGAFEDDNVEENNVTFLGSQFTGNFLMYENVDPSKVRRGNYVNLPDFLNAPHQIYLDCYMKGYIVPVSFWQQLVPHFCMPDMHRLPHGTPIGWLSGEHMNSWMELCIRRRNADANWTVAYTSTISVHPENNRFIIPTDQHVIGTLDGTTRPYPAWNDVDWVFMPIHVAGNHWATGVIHLPSSHFYVFDSMYNEQNKDVLSRLIQCIDVPQQTNFSDYGVITCWLIPRLCAEIKPVMRETRLRQSMSSPGAPSAGPSTPPSYFSRPLTPPNYYPGSSRNAECSNCKHLRGKISVLKATMEMHMHSKQHTVNSAALFHEVLNEMEKLDLE